jgi:hypothetical protein
MKGHIRPRGKRSFQLKFDAGRDASCHKMMAGEPKNAAASKRGKRK